MAENENYAKKKMSRVQLHERITAAICKEMAEYHEAGKAVWQLPDEEKEKFFLPFNPVAENYPDKDGNPVEPGRYFQSGNAMYLMQKQQEYANLGYPNDNRWIEEKDLEKYHLLKKEDAEVVNIPVGYIKQVPFNGELRNVDSRAYIKVVNFTQLVPEEGYNLPKAVYQQEYRGHGSYMLKHNSFSKVEYAMGEDGQQHKIAGSEKEISSTEVQENFFKISRNAYLSACYSREDRSTYIDAKKRQYKEGLAQYADKIAAREDALLSMDVSGSIPKSKEKAFVHCLAAAAQAQAEKNGGKLQNSAYVFTAAKKSLLAGASDKDVTKYIDKYAPGAATNEYKAKHGMQKYGAYTMEQLGKDTKFLKEYSKKAMAI